MDLNNPATLVMMFNVLLTLIVSGVSAILICLFDLGRMYHKVKKAQGNQKEILRATDRFRWSSITLAGIFLVYNLTYMYRMGVPLW